MQAEITLDISGTIIDCTVEYQYHPAVPAQLSCHPDNRTPGEPEEWVFSSMKYGYVELVDMLAIHEIESTVIEMIKEAWQ